jgi:hypothetical protein
MRFFKFFGVVGFSADGAVRRDSLYVVSQHMPLLNWAVANEKKKQNTFRSIL